MTGQPGANDEIRASEIRNVVNEHGNLSVDATTLGDEDNLYDAGMNSHSTVRVMLAIEERLGVRFPDELLTRETFVSLASLERAVTYLSGSS